LHSLQHHYSPSNLQPRPKPIAPERLGNLHDSGKRPRESIDPYDTLPYLLQKLYMSGNNHTLGIAPGGDLILQISQEEQGAQFSYRVDATILQQQSRYFENLLSDRFSEGQALKVAIEALPNIADAPSEHLHKINIINVGRISKISSIQNLVADLLRALHGQDLSVTSPPLANLANLAVVADRFDALSCLAKYIRRKKYLQLIDAKSKSRPLASQSEEKSRQKLLIGLLFDHPPWVTKYSKHLIMHDSVQWRPGFEPDNTLALWWDIPWGVEGQAFQAKLRLLMLMVGRRTYKATRTHFRNGKFSPAAFSQALHLRRKAVQVRLRLFASM
jgi:hypothetical protein